MAVLPELQHQGIGSRPSPVPDEAFMLLILNEKTMSGMHGVARYRNEFDEACRC
jgi:predicted N-acetyltransferase YhbS